MLNTSALPPPPNPPAYPVSLLHPDRVRARSPAAETAAETSATLAGDGARKRSNAWSTPPSASHDARYLCSAFSTVIACARYALAVSPAVLLRVRVRVRALAREASVDVSSSGGDASDASDAPSPLRVNAGERTRRSIVRLTSQTKRTLKGKRGRSATTGKVLKKRRSHRERGRIGTSLTGDEKREPTADAQQPRGLLHQVVHALVERVRHRARDVVFPVMLRDGARGAVR